MIIIMHTALASPLFNEQVKDITTESLFCYRTIMIIMYIRLYRLYSDRRHHYNNC